MLANIAVIGMRALMMFLCALSAVLLYKTTEYFQILPQKHKIKPVLAWDILVLLGVLVYSVVKLLII